VLEIIDLLMGIQLSDIILYLVSGFIFIYTYKFLTITSNPKEYEHILINSFIIGFALRNVFGIITYRFTNHNLNVAIYLLASFITAFIIAKIVLHPKLKPILRRLGVKRTINEYLWGDITDPTHPLWIEVTIQSINRKYFGQIVLIEDFQREPQIVLSRYEIWNLNGEKLSDFDQKPNYRIMIDISKCDEIRFIYDKDSEYVLINDRIKSY